MEMDGTAIEGACRCDSDASLSVKGLMDAIKTEPKTNPLTLHDGINEEGEPLSTERNVLKVHVKVESSDQSYDLVSEIKCEENGVPITFPVKFEVQEESRTVKEEQLSDVSVQDDDLTERPPGRKSI
ncbi:uncharacterized protein [Periplaneta americana]|uniref:uncharacterized protein isoform X4 n=1 Tax=Periplaneta americana TaxID=6978 RepID=UPI0037E8F954